jgi:hypothetical protein
VTVQGEQVVGWIAAFVALWWIIDWLSLRQEGEVLPLQRAPLRVLADVLRKLRRNRSFLAAIVALWLIGAATSGLIIYFRHLGAALPEQAPSPLIAGPLSFTDTVPELLAGELPEALPRLLEVPLGLWGRALFVVLLIALIVRLNLDPPEEIGAETARKLRWPGALLVLYLVALVAVMIAGQPLLDELTPDGRYARVYTWFVIFHLVIVPGLLLAPAIALLWRLVLEIARDGAWSFTSAIRSLADSWVPVAIALLVANALRPLAVLGGGYGGAWGIAYLVLLVLLVFVPWATLDRRYELTDALAHSWRLFRQRPIEVIAFLLRFTLLFAVLGGIVALFEPSAPTLAAPWYMPLLEMVRYALLLLQVMVLARLYVHLNELLRVDDACTGCVVGPDSEADI